MTDQPPPPGDDWERPQQPPAYPSGGQGAGPGPGEPPAYPGRDGDDFAAMKPLGAMPAGEFGDTEKPPVPPSLTMAVKLMYAGAALSLISLIVTLFSRGQIHDAVVKANNKQTGSKHLSADQIDTLVNISFAIGIVLGLIGVLLWLLMARTNQSGRWWARIVATVLCLLCVLSTFSALTRSGSTGPTTILSIIMVLIAIGATVLLYRPDSNDFFARCKVLRGQR